MLKVDGVLYYSCNELANAINYPDCNRSLEQALKREWNKRWNRAEDCYTTYVYVQSKLYAAVKNHQIKYLKYKKNNSGRDFMSFAIQDVLNWIKEFNFPMTRGFEQITDIEIVEVEHVYSES